MPLATRDFSGYGALGPQTYWPDGARIAVSLVVNFEEGSERTPLYGDSTVDATALGFRVPPGTRSLLNETFFEYGARVGHWRLLDLFAKHGVVATYFACAEALRRNQLAARSITDAGHEPASHGYRWYPLDKLSDSDLREHIRLAVEITQATTGERPTGWFSRLPSPRVRDLLVEEGGFLYDCDSFADDVPYYVAHPAAKWLIVPYSFVTNDMKFLRPQGYTSSDDFYVQLRMSFDELYAEGERRPQMMSVGIHPRYSGRPSIIGALDDFIGYAKGRPGVWFARRDQIAQWWRQEFPDLPAMRS